MGKPTSWELTYHITQALTGHACYSSYLYKIGKEEAPTCWMCAYKEDNPEHTYFECTAWKAVKDKFLPEEIHKKKPEELLTWATSKKENWRKFAGWITEILKTKEENERQREEIKIRKIT